MADLGPSINAKDYLSLKKVAIFVGAPDFRNGPEFVARVWVQDKSLIPELTSRILGIGRGRLETIEEDGWTVCKSRVRWPGVVRYKDDLLEFGTELYAYSPPAMLFSPTMQKAYKELDEGSDLRMALDAQVLSQFFGNLMQLTEADEDAVYKMVKWGEFVSDSSLALYGIQLLRDLETGSMSVNMNAEVMAEFKIVPQQGKEGIVGARAKVLHDFLLFHIKLPIQTLKGKNNPVADVLEKFASNLRLTVNAPEIKLTLKKPEGIAESLASIMEKMKGSFARKEDMNRMKVMGLAAHNYHDTFRRFPLPDDPRRADRLNKNLSWRVKVLPFIEHNRDYDQMNLTQPWDAKANQQVVAKCQDAFLLSNGAMICLSLIHI